LKTTLTKKMTTRTPTDSVSRVPTETPRETPPPMEYSGE